MRCVYSLSSEGVVQVEIGHSVESHEEPSSPNRVFCHQSCCYCFSSEESDLCVAQRGCWSRGREGTCRALLLNGVAPLFSAAPCFESIRNIAVP